MNSLNDIGRVVYKHKYAKYLFAEIPYHWCDYISIIDESGDTRRCVVGLKFSEFSDADWIPLTVEEYKKVKRYFKDIYKDTYDEN